MRGKLVAAMACATVATAMSASVAFAGEVIGPPGTPGVPFSAQPDLSTAAPFHSQSICSYNGLNDMIPSQGQITYIVQTPHNQGVPGQAGADVAGSGTPGSPTCGGGSNFRNP
jgi:hypothetical protein